MKKLLAISLLLLASCAGVENAPGNVTETGAVIKDSACENIKGVRDPQNGGKIYYAPEHRLYSFIQLEASQGDKNFCTLDLAKRAGFDTAAPQYFEDSAYKQIQCLRSEGENGKCHTYIDGIFQSLRIYGKTCGNPSKSDLADAYESHANKVKNGLDVSKYSGATGAFLKKYGC